MDYFPIDNIDTLSVENYIFELLIQLILVTCLLQLQPEEKCIQMSITFDMLIKHQTCIYISTNKPSIGSVVLETAPSIWRKSFQN